MIALLMSAPILGLDNFAVALAIGLARSDWATRIKVCVVFGGYAAIAPLVGMELGASLAAVLGGGTRYLAGAILAAIGIRMILIATRESDHARPPMAACASLKSIAVVGLAVSLDTTAAGLALGVYGVNWVVAVSVIAAGTVLMSLTGLALAGRIAPKWPFREQLGGLALAIVGVAVMASVI